MFDFSTVTIDTVVVHHVGCPAEDEEVLLSDNPIAMPDETMQELLFNYFLKPFKEGAFWNFTHEADLQNNNVYRTASEIFENQGNLYKKSIYFAELLYDAAIHPKIKGGELYTVYFKDCVVDGEIMDAIGLFKSENKETYLRVERDNKDFEVAYENGINIKKLDKGCLIFNTEKELGYKVCIIDKTGKGEEALYWKDDFLGVKLREDNFYHTQTHLNICKGFIEEVYNEKNAVERPEQINLQKKAVEFFEEGGVYDPEKFEEAIFEDSDVTEAFREYKEQYLDTHEIKTFEEFDIAPKAVKTAKRQFKNIIKLDKNFRIHVDGNTERLEKGYDEEKKLHYYKLYFREEE